jgi:hypothetical protein
MTSRWSNSVLLVAMLLLLGVEPFVHEQMLFDTLVSLMLLAAVWVVSQKRDLLVATFVLMVLAFVARWLLYALESHWLAVIAAVFGMSVLALTMFVLLRRAFGGATVTADTIAGAVCAYLIVGVLWAFVFSLIELASPGAFQVNGVPMAATTGTPKVLRHELLYLSLVTLSTVGYGDIVPVVPPARMLAVLEAVTGQVYLAVLIGGLVGMRMQRARDA